LSLPHLLCRLFALRLQLQPLHPPLVLALECQRLLAPLFLGLLPVGSPCEASTAFSTLSKLHPPSALWAGYWREWLGAHLDYVRHCAAEGCICSKWGRGLSMPARDSAHFPMARTNICILGKYGKVPIRRAETRCWRRSPKVRGPQRFPLLQCWTISTHAEVEFFDCTVKKKLKAFLMKSTAFGGKENGVDWGWDRRGGIYNAKRRRINIACKLQLKILNKLKLKVIVASPLEFSVNWYAVLRHTSKIMHPIVTISFLRTQLWVS
jgi:hypothetical protein